MKSTRGFSRPGPIGLDIGACSVKAVQCRGDLPVASVRFDRVNAEKPIDSAELNAIAAVLRRRGFSGREVAVSATPEKLKMSPLELPAKGAGVPIDRLARAEFIRLNKVELDQSEFTYWETPTAARLGKATSLMAVAYSHADAEQQIALFESTGLRIRAIDTHGSSLARACSDHTAGIKAAAILDIGWSAAVLVMVRNGVVAYERRIADLALSKLHNELDRSTGASFEEMLPILFGSAESRPAAVTDILTDYFNEIAGELTKTIAYARHQFPDAAVERVILAGGGSELPFVAEQVEAICGLQTVKADISGTTKSMSISPLASAFGLALFAA